jgi:hypothetical protein
MDRGTGRPATEREPQIESRGSRDVGGDGRRAFASRAYQGIDRCGVKGRPVELFDYALVGGGIGFVVENVMQLGTGGEKANEQPKPKKHARHASFAVRLESQWSDPLHAVLYLIDFRHSARHFEAEMYGRIPVSKHPEGVTINPGRDAALCTNAGNRAVQCRWLTRTG